MGDELQKRLLAYLDAAERGIREAGPAVGGELEQLVREWLAWEFWNAVLMAGGLLAGAAVLGVAAVKLFRFVRSGQADSDTGPPAFVAGTFAGILAVPLLIHGLLSVRDAVKVCVAPRVVVMEKVAGLAKSVRK